MIRHDSIAKVILEGTVEGQCRRGRSRKKFFQNRLQLLILPGAADGGGGQGGVEEATAAAANQPRVEYMYVEN